MEARGRLFLILIGSFSLLAGFSSPKLLVSRDVTVSSSFRLRSLVSINSLSVDWPDLRLILARVARHRGEDRGYRVAVPESTGSSAVVSSSSITGVCWRCR